MTKNDAPLINLADIAEALTLLSRLPIASQGKRGSAAVWAYPVAGLAIGGIAGAAGHLTVYLGLPTALAAIAALACQIIITGAMHEDGFADSVDGLWGGWDRTRRLEIMKDSQIGSYGVIALCLSLTCRWVLLWFLFDLNHEAAPAAIAVAAALSRAAMPVLMWSLPHARADGLSHSVGAPSVQSVLIGLAIAAFAACILTLSTALPAIIAAGCVTLVVRQIARAKINGQTGDILGATQQMVEIVVLTAIIA
ncbi:adenosylcobinamide-GDP ribazoletransferase [Pseudohalocynthiibacter aestuariivivens]|uniref:Adenosylcobinamide-GDP ribazoletransferase n=1 Tax=Roseovarius pelagicus TaxID=2980108 RepID=A0ABY6DGS1_9RHOB|nr:MULTISPECIES: adenosylcobinamide-GDP ribazoletransferase [Rhodobacterales]QIE47278.1 adenosylcobinamide-GDP ribazoletransferase [Pseudohalocynthiibacter aestuariivivens]UXX84163.1 adenosylcobinamide-GDP ribazoletransferase [Roseovarius pelagicus]